MKDQLVDIATAKLAAVIGFDKYCRFAYSDDGSVENASDWIGEDNFSKTDIDSANENGYKSLLAPTRSSLQKWIREKHNQHVVVIPNGGEWDYFRSDVVSDDHSDFFTTLSYEYDKGNIGAVYESFESALEDGLRHCMTNILSSQRKLQEQAKTMPELDIEN